MKTSLQIPRFRDLELSQRLSQVVRDIPEIGEFQFRATNFLGVEMSAVGFPEESEAFNETFEADTESLQSLAILSANARRTIVTVSRNFDKEYDDLNFDQTYINEQRTNNGSLLLKLWSSARRNLKALDAEISMAADSADGLNRFHKVHVKLVSGLEKSAQALIGDTARIHSTLEAARQKRFDELEDSLRAALASEKAILGEEHRIMLEAIDARSAELDEKWKEFEKEESHLVARKKREEQLKEIREGLRKWSLTDATENKRLPVTFACAIGIFTGGLFAWISASQIFQLIAPPADPTKVLWWQWLSLSLKVAFSLAFSGSLLVYLIRWNSDWAKLHAEEELQNRSLLIDIGRTSWLLEAVRDAQERGGEIPSDLLKELSRNLFAYSKSPGGDTEPTAVTDMILQGLSSLRFKSPDGTEVEAKRGKV